MANVTQKLAEAYFASLNPIASRIADEISQVQSNYEHLWETLSHNRRLSIINGAIVCPDVALNYFDRDEDNTTVSLTNSSLIETFCHLETGLRQIHDDTIGTFRDEHSAPFSVKTKSQMDLQLFASSTLASEAKKTNEPMEKLTVASCDGITPASIALAESEIFNQLVSLNQSQHHCGGRSTGDSTDGAKTFENNVSATLASMDSEDRITEAADDCANGGDEAAAHYDEFRSLLDTSQLLNGRGFEFLSNW